jgi:riboflavin kinase/FMN adenylyltransferase
MKIHHGFEEWEAVGRTVASLGNYDGVHLGHQAILKRVVECAKHFHIPSVAITFDPVPKKILNPKAAPQLIQTLDQRLRKLESMAIDHTIVLAFNESLAKMSPHDFVNEFLISELHIEAFIVGQNFSFGHQKSGNVTLLKEMGLKHHFEVEGIPEVLVDGIRVSSSLIREMIRSGRVKEAYRMLGDPFSLTGSVVVGDRLGSKLGIPTANLQPENEILPANGVYLTDAMVRSERCHSVTNVGVRPTMGGTKLTIESHLLNFSGDLYGQRIELRFLDKLRDEIRFPGVDELKSQILSDIRHAEEFFDRG